MFAINQKVHDALCYGDHKHNLKFKVNKGAVIACRVIGGFLLNINERLNDKFGNVSGQKLVNCLVQPGKILPGFFCPKLNAPKKYSSKKYMFDIKCSALLNAANRIHLNIEEIPEIVKTPLFLKN